MSDTLNLDRDEARALHRIVRAMHDGECPKCHAVHPSERMRYRLQGFTDENGNHYPFATRESGWQCPSCRFKVTQDEADAVLKIFAPFMERNLAIFEQWRSERSQNTV